jgi:hypothetical protein
MSILYMKPFLFYSLCVFLIIFIVLVSAYSIKRNNDKFLKEMEKVKENYTNYSLEEATGKFPNATEKLLVQDSYHPTGNKYISDNTSNDIWWHYPTFQEGSYDQITNNIKYPNNPDEGTCMPASMCQTLYKDSNNKSNYVYALPPVAMGPTNAVRVNYYNT